MQNYQQSRKLEDEYRPVFKHLLEAEFGCRAIPNRKQCKGSGAPDFFLDNVTATSIETKIERNHTGHLFIETFSNFADDRTQPDTLGWLYTSKADEIWYGFSDKMIVYRTSLSVLRKYLLEDVPCSRPFSQFFAYPRLLGYKERKQKCAAQRNVTIGRLVPIVELKAQKILTTISMPTVESIRESVHVAA